MTLYLEESAMKLFAFDIKRGCRMSIRASMKRQARLCWGRVLNTHTEGEAKEHGITRQKVQAKAQVELSHHHEQRCSLDSSECAKIHVYIYIYMSRTKAKHLVQVLN